MHETRGEKVFDYCYDANGQLYAVATRQILQPTQ